MDIPPKAVKAAVADRMKSVQMQSMHLARRRRRRLMAAVLGTAVAGAFFWWRLTRETSVGDGKSLVDRASASRSALPAEGDRAGQASRAAAPVPVAPGDGSAKLRAIAEQALRHRFPNLDLSAFRPGYLVYMENQAEAPVPFVFVDWLGTDALAVERGGTPDRDRKQVRKLRVKLTADGTLIDVQDTRVWLYRTGEATP